MKLYNCDFYEIFVGLFLMILICDACPKLESENLQNFLNKKLVVSIFVTNTYIL